MFPITFFTLSVLVLREVSQGIASLNMIESFQVLNVLDSILAYVVLPFLITTITSFVGITLLDIRKQGKKAT